MSAPPDNRTVNQPAPTQQTQHNMNQNQEPHPEPQHSNVRHIPIFVEGRDEPVINRNVDHGGHYESKPPPPQPHIDRDQYFADDAPPSFHHPPNFSRTFGTPFNKGFRQGPQPFQQQKVYPQTAFARAASPQRSQSPKQPHHEEHFVKVPVHHEPPSKQKQQQQQQQQPQPPQPKQPTPPPQQASPPPPQSKPSPNDPISQILCIQTEVLNLMTEVENFKGAKNDKQYLFLDEMLTRNLIKLDNIETDGKENIRAARKEAIRCIQKCIAVLEAKADSNSRPQEEQKVEQPKNGEVDMKEDTKEEAAPAPAPDVQEPQKAEDAPPVEPAAEAPQDAPAPAPSPDTRPAEPQPEQAPAEDATEQKTPNKVAKTTKKRDKSKEPNKDSTEPKDDSKTEAAADNMQIDEKGDKTEQTMDVDGASASQ